MPRNVERRGELADAGLRVLARDGARGLTHRAVDREVGAPEGTAANYFRTRDALLGALGDRIMERLQPAPERLEELEGRPPDLALFTEYMRDLVQRTTSAPELMIWLT